MAEEKIVVTKECPENANKYEDAVYLGEFKMFDGQATVVMYQRIEPNPEKRRQNKRAFEQAIEDMIYNVHHVRVTATVTTPPRPAEWEEVAERLRNKQKKDTHSA